MNCKPGDLAIVIGANPDWADCVGRIVRILRLDDNKFDSWVIEFAGSVPASLRKYFDMEKAAGDSIDIICEDRVLKPVSGIPDTEQTDEREPIKDVA